MDRRDPHLGYQTRLIALNSMYAQPQVTAPAPQSRDRLYLAYWLASLGRAPDWDRLLRPAAWCEHCGNWVRAVQWWKRRGADMGRYRQSHLYRFPNLACRCAVVEPLSLPAAAAIDWTSLGTRIGDRARPMREATRAATIADGLLARAISSSPARSRSAASPGGAANWRYSRATLARDLSRDIESPAFLDAYLGDALRRFATGPVDHLKRGLAGVGGAAATMAFQQEVRAASCAGHCRPHAAGHLLGEPSDG